jgi:hypothetical protein
MVAQTRLNVMLYAHYLRCLSHHVFVRISLLQNGQHCFLGVQVNKKVLNTCNSSYKGAGTDILHYTARGGYAFPFLCKRIFIYTYIHTHTHTHTHTYSGITLDRSAEKRSCIWSCLEIAACTVTEICVFCLSLSLSASYNDVTVKKTQNL